MNMIELAILAEFVVFGPRGHQPRGALDYCPLIEWNPDFTSPFRIVVKTIERICEVYCCVDVQYKRRAVRVGREKVRLTRHLNYSLPGGRNVRLANSLGDFLGRK